ncbi:MAG: hypothetical protein OWS74_01315, partial [Firmicutes bacterium]|nr:hypothetical protein [Bacillota bacterium]
SIYLWNHPPLHQILLYHSSLLLTAGWDLFNFAGMFFAMLSAWEKPQRRRSERRVIERGGLLTAAHQIFPIDVHDMSETGVRFSGSTLPPDLFDDRTATLHIGMWHWPVTLYSTRIASGAAKRIDWIAQINALSPKDFQNLVLFLYGQMESPWCPDLKRLWTTYHPQPHPAIAPINYAGSSKEGSA